MARFLCFSIRKKNLGCSKIKKNNNQPLVGIIPSVENTSQMNDFLSQKPNIIKNDAPGQSLMCSEGRSPEEMPSSSYAPAPKTLPAAGLRAGMQPQYNERQTPLFPVHTIVLNKQRSSTTYPRPTQGGVRRPSQQYFPPPSAAARQKTEVIGEEGPTVKQHLQQQQKQRREKERQEQRVEPDMPQGNGVMLLSSGGPSSLNGKPGVKAYTILPAGSVHMQNRPTNGRLVSSINRGNRPGPLPTRQIIVAQPGGSQTTPPPGVTTFHSQDRLNNNATGSRYIISHSALPGNSQIASTVSGHVSGTTQQAASTSRSASLNDSRFSPIERKSSALVAALERKDEADMIAMAESSMYHQQASTSYPNSIEASSVNSPHSAGEMYESHGATLIDDVNVNASFTLDSLDPGELSQYLGDYSLGDIQLDPLLGSSALTLDDSLESQDNTPMSSSNSSSNIQVKPRAELSDDISSFFGAGNHKPLGDPFFSQISIGKKDDLADFPEHFLETDTEDEAITIQTTSTSAPEVAKKVDQISPTGISLVDWVENDNFIMDPALHVNGEDFSQIFADDNALDCPEFANSIMEDGAADFSGGNMSDGSMGMLVSPPSNRGSMPVIPQPNSQSSNTSPCASVQSETGSTDSPSKKRQRSRQMKDGLGYAEGEPQPKARSRKQKSPRSKEAEMEKKLEKAAKMDKKREDERIQKQRKAEIEAAEKAKQQEESERKLQKERETVERVIRIQQELLEREKEEAALRKEAQQGSKPRVRNRNSGTSRSRGSMKPGQRIVVMPKSAVPGQPLPEEIFSTSRAGNPNMTPTNVVWMSSATSVVPSGVSPRNTIPSPHQQNMFQQPPRQRQTPPIHEGQNQQYGGFHPSMAHSPMNMPSPSYPRNPGPFGEQHFSGQQNMAMQVNGTPEQFFMTSGPASNPLNVAIMSNSDGRSQSTPASEAKPSPVSVSLDCVEPMIQDLRTSPPEQHMNQQNAQCSNYPASTSDAFPLPHVQQINSFYNNQQFSSNMAEQQHSALSEMIQPSEQILSAYNSPHAFSNQPMSNDQPSAICEAVKDEQCIPGQSQPIEENISSVEKTIEEVIQKMHNEELDTIIEGMSSNFEQEVQEVEKSPKRQEASEHQQSTSTNPATAPAKLEPPPKDELTDEDKHFADLFQNVDASIVDDLNTADFVDGLDLVDFDFSQFNNFLEASDELAPGALDLFMDSEGEPSSSERDTKETHLDENADIASRNSEEPENRSSQGPAVVPNINVVDENLVDEIAHDDVNYPTEWLLQMLDEPLSDAELMRLGLCPMNKESFLFEEEEIHYPENLSQQESEKYYQMDCDRHDMASLLSFLPDDQINHEINMMEACMIEEDVEPTEDDYAHKLGVLTENCTGLIYVNAALVDEISRLSQRIVVSTEERKILARRLCHHDRNYIRRLQTAKKRKAETAKRRQEAEAQGLTYEPPKRYRKDEPKSTPPKPLLEELKDKEMSMRRSSYGHESMDDSFMRAEKFVKEIQLMQLTKPTRGRKPGRGRGSGRGRGRGSGPRNGRSDTKKARSVESMQASDDFQEDYGNSFPESMKDDFSQEDSKARDLRRAELTRRFRAAEARGQALLDEHDPLSELLRDRENGLVGDHVAKEEDAKDSLDEHRLDDLNLSQTPSDPSDPGTPLNPDEKPRYGTRQASKRTTAPTSSETTPDANEENECKPILATPPTRGRPRGRGRKPRNVLYDGVMIDGDSKNSSRQSSRSTSHQGSPAEGHQHSTMDAKPKQGRGRPPRSRTATFSTPSDSAEIDCEIKKEEINDRIIQKVDVSASCRSSRSRSRNSKENTPHPNDSVKEEILEEDAPIKPRRGRGRPPGSASLVIPASASSTPPPPDPDTGNTCKKRPHTSPYMHELSLLNDGIDPYTPKKDVDDDYEPPAKRRTTRKASEVVSANRPTRQSQRRKS